MSMVAMRAGHSVPSVGSNEAMVVIAKDQI